MKHAILTLLTLIGISLLPSSVVRAESNDSLPEWQSQYATGLNKLEPHAYVWPYADQQAVDMRDHESSTWYQSLNGKWKFRWTRNPDNRPKEFYKPSFYTGGWADILVPGNWERQGYGTAMALVKYSVVKSGLKSYLSA